MMLVCVCMCVCVTEIPAKHNALIAEGLCLNWKEKILTMLFQRKLDYVDLKEIENIIKIKQI